MLNQILNALKPSITKPDFTTKGISWTLHDLIALKRYANLNRHRTRVTSEQQGMYRSSRKGRGMDFAEVRHYQAGDDIRHMEWRVTAKTGKPHIKLYEEERERPIILVVDFNPSMYFGTKSAFKSYVATEIATLIAWHANITGDKVGGFLFTNESHHAITPKGREAGVLPLLAMLAQYSLPPEKHTNNHKDALSNALSRLRKTARPGSLIVLIGDFYTLNASATQQLARLRQHSEILAYHITDPIERSAPSLGIYPLTDGEEPLSINTFDKKFLNAYNETRTHQNQKIKETFQKLAAFYIHVTSPHDLPGLVSQTFPRRHHG